VDGGAYDELYKPNGHWNEYADRTLAHNCLLIYDPAQVFAKGYGNDGGQTVLRGLQHHGDWQMYLTHRQKEHLNTGEVAAYEHDSADRFCYARVNLKQAYGDRVTACDRQFVYLPHENYFVVFDRVSAASETFQKRWLLHFQDAPAVDGTTPEAGVTSFPGAQVTTERHTGVLFVDTLLPADHTVTVIGGPGYEYFNSFNGRNYPPVHPSAAAEARESGRWRIEVAPNRAQRDDKFLHAFQIAGPEGKKPVEVRRLSDASGRISGVQFAGASEHHVVLFAENVALPMRYDLTSTLSAEHLVVEMPALLRVTIEVNGRRLARATTSAEGTLTFSDRARGRRTITIR
jgi:hypothetical protein